MKAYIIKRLLLIIPTLLGIMVLNFAIVQVAPGGPVEQLMMQLESGHGASATARFAGGSGEIAHAGGGDYRGRQGLEPELIEQIKKQYGFDKPPLERFTEMIGKYARFDFGSSFYQDKSVIDLVIEKMPVSISLGIWSTLLIYLISIPLGIRKAMKDGSYFDVWSSFVIVIGYAIPSFLFAIFLVILFAGGTYWDIFPLRGLVSDNWHELPPTEQIKDYLWHMVLPVTAMSIGGFAALTMLTKNSFLDEINKQYVLTARSKGLSERKVLYRHVFRNAMLIVIAGFPVMLLGMLFTGSLLIEVIFSLDGLGLLSYEAVVNRDYPVFFGTLYIFTLFGLILTIIRDIAYIMVDPRIDFDKR
ncbi:MAG: microcin ABC transporter permease [Alphaproteobacteria bacterium CG11_big_fil_rev_8_21_14_0_20_44_7]|nr:MAG: microcin ABC transporter permease [Alphaproteobacteria bacterium CG11_big_fil_rev_8_21_14_0_20_44_7]